jgi:type II secretory pathway component PulF
VPVYLYRGYDSEGKKVKGKLSADGQGEAVLRLKDTGIYPSQLSEYVHWKRRAFLRWKAPKNVLTHFTRQLATLTASGVSLSEALKSLSDEYGGHWHGLVTSLSERVLEGASLSRAISQHPDTFPEYYAKMISASETGGNLSEVLETLADFLETDATLKNRVRTALLYPSFMVIISVFVLSFVFTFVVPKILSIFEHSQASLPYVTVVLLKVSYVFQNYWWLLGSLFVASVFLLRKLHGKYPHYLHGVALRIPFMRSLYYSRFTGTLGFLLKGGIPVLRALELSSKVSGNSLLERDVLRGMKRVSEGGTIASSLQGISPVLKQLISTGEKSGQLPALLIKTSHSYKEDFIRLTEEATSLLEPLLILLMGSIVGFIVFGVLLPIFQINQLIR